MVYETRPMQQQILRQNLEVNKVAGTTTMMRRALGAPRDLPRADCEFHATVVDTLDALLLDKLELLKIREDAPFSDILEGASESIWAPASASSNQCARRGCIVYGGAAREGIGYRCWRIETPLFHSANFNRRGTDIFNSEIALALFAIPEEIDTREALGGCVEIVDRADQHAAAAQSPSLSESLGTAVRGEAGMSRFLRKLLR